MQVTMVGKLRAGAVAGLWLLAAVGCASDGADKVEFDPAELDESLATDPKADYYTNRTTILGTIRANTYVEGRFIAGGFSGFTFAGTAGQVVSLALDATDGTSDPVLMLYGPRRSTGTWPTRIGLNDDAVGLDSRLWDVSLPGDGTYLAVAAEYYRGAGTYDLSLWAEDVTLPDAPPAPVCTDVPTVATSNVRYNRWEAPRFRNACTVDTDCFRTGCSGEVCAAENVPTTCEAITRAGGTCGCVANVCVWNVEVCE